MFGGGNSRQGSSQAIDWVPFVDKEHVDKATEEINAVNSCSPLRQQQRTSLAQGSDAQIHLTGGSLLRMLLT